MATLTERLAKAKAAAEAAESRAADPAFAEEERARKEIADFEARAQEIADREHALKIARAIDFWRDKIGEDAEVLAVSIDAKPHDFIVTAAGTAAYRVWQKGLTDVAMSKVKPGTRQKVDADDVARTYAVAGILQWNDKIVDERGGDVSTEDGKSLNDFLRNEPAIVTEILNRVSRLDGGAADERKS